MIPLRIVMLVIALVVFTPSFKGRLQSDTCPGAPPSRLIVGGQGQRLPGFSSNVRNQPTTRGEFLSQIPPNGIFTVLEGPVCADGYAWWRVNYDGLFGWTPEGFPGDYWLQPFPPTSAVQMPPSAEPIAPPVEIFAPPIQPEPALMVGVSEVSATFADRDTIAFINGLDDNPQIFLIDSDGKNITRLTRFGGYNPEWSADGTKLMFQSAGGFSIVDLQRDEYRYLEILERGAPSISGLVASPTGTQIAFVAHDGNDNIYTVDVLTGELRNLTQSIEWAGLPTYSPDGSLIAFSLMATSFDTSHIYAMPVDGSAAMYRVTDDNAYETSPAWSPDGTMIAYLSFGQLAIIENRSRVGNQLPVLLAEGLVAPSQPVWSPDGQHIAVVGRSTASSGQANLYVVDVETGNATMINDELATDLPVSWSPDSRWLVYHGVDRNIYIISRNGSEHVLLTRTEGDYAAIPRWRPRK